MAHADDAWIPVLEDLIAAQPEPATVPDAIAPLAHFGIDVAAVQARVDAFLGLARADWEPDDYRHTHPEFPDKYAAAAYIHTMEAGNVYRHLSQSMHAVDRGVGPGGVSADLRACLPFVKLLDVALIEAAIFWGFFVGQTLRGVKHAFPSVADHDPERHFMPGGVGRELPFYEFNSSATDPQVMYEAHFCGRRGPRTIFTIQSTQGVSIKKFSAIPGEEEVLFRPLSRFQVTNVTKHLTAGDLRDNVHPNNGFPDSVHMQQLSTIDLVALLRERLHQRERLVLWARRPALALPPQDEIIIVTNGNGNCHAVEHAEPDGAYRVVSGGWQNTTTMTMCNGKLYNTAGQKFGRRGGGGLYWTDITTATSRQIGEDWGNSTTMTACGGFLYITTGVLGGCAGTGGLYRVDPNNGETTQLGGLEWRNATVAAECMGSLYIICGQMGGCVGGGGLYRVDPSTGAYQQILGPPGADGVQGVDPESRHEAADGTGRWINACTMTAHDGSLFITCGAMGGCEGTGGLYRVNPNSGAFRKIYHPSQPGGQGYINAITSVSRGGSLYFTCGAFSGSGCKGAGGLYRVNPATGETVKLGTNHWKNATASA